MSMDLYRFSKTLPRELRTGKKILRDLYKDKLPKCVLEQPKKPLRLYDDKEKNIQMVQNSFRQNFKSTNLA